MAQHEANRQWQAVVAIARGGEPTEDPSADGGPERRAAARRALARTGRVTLWAGIAASAVVAIVTTVLGAVQALESLSPTGASDPFRARFRWSDADGLTMGGELDGSIVLGQPADRANIARVIVGALVGAGRTELTTATVIWHATLVLVVLLLAAALATTVAAPFTDAAAPTVWLWSSGIVLTTGAVISQALAIVGTARADPEFAVWSPLARQWWQFDWLPVCAGLALIGLGAFARRHAQLRRDLRGLV